MLSAVAKPPWLVLNLGSSEANATTNSQDRYVTWAASGPPQVAVGPGSGDSANSRNRSQAPFGSAAGGVAAHAAGCGKGLEMFSGQNRE